MVLVAFATLAFKAPSKNTLAQKYGYDQNIPENQNRWVLIDGLGEDNSSTPAPNTYRCEASSDVCSAMFTTPPTSSSSIPDVGTTTLGEFSLN